ncbi:MAG: DUF2170 family protein [Pseudomonadota bacterium]
MTWDLPQLEKLFTDNPSWSIRHEAECICVTNADGLEAFVAVSGAQILAETVLFSAGQVRDAAALNDEILRTHQLFPLTTVSLATIDDEDYYVAFGALSSQSKGDSVMIEIESLFDNVAGFLEAYQDHLA